MSSLWSSVRKADRLHNRGGVMTYVALATAPIFVWAITSDSPLLTCLDLAVGLLSFAKWDRSELSRRAWATRKIVSGSVIDHDQLDERMYRKRMDVSLKTPKWVTVDYEELNGIGAWVAKYMPSAAKSDGDGDRSADAEETMILYAHGGRLVAGNAGTYMSLLSTWINPLRATACIVDYSVAPEVPLSYVPQEFASAYRAALRRIGGAERLVLASDGAGASVILKALSILHEEGYPMPAGILLLSPSVDLTAHYDPNKRDRLISGRSLNALAGVAGSEEELADVSPLYFKNADAFFRQLPPTLILYDAGDMSSDESALLAKRLEAAGNSVQVIERRGMWPNWLLTYFVFPEGLQDMEQVCAFVDRVTHRPPQPPLPARLSHPLIRRLQQLVSPST